MHVEDHPLEYGGFEGTIPKGEYGGGTVMLWDRGAWEPLNDPHEGLKEGKLHFRLHGERLKGGWALIRMPPRGREKRENWLLIKERDEEADESDKLLTKHEERRQRSHDGEDRGGDAVWHSNRPARGDGATALRKRKAAAKHLLRLRNSAHRSSPPSSTTFPRGRTGCTSSSMTATACSLPRAAARCAAIRGAGRTGRQSSRRSSRRYAPWTCRQRWTMAKWSPSRRMWRTDFSTLQRALGEGGRLDFFAFDLLEEAGENLTGRPLTERKRRLQALLAGLPEQSPIHYSDHIHGEGKAVLAKICAAGHEGIVSKKATAPYRGARTKTWLKIKCQRRQELVIGGWTPSDKRHGFKSLLLGTWEDGKLIYRGRVGTGFDEKDLEELSARSAKLARKTSPRGGAARGAPLQMGRAEACRRDRILGIHLGRHSAPPVFPGIARGQAGARGACRRTRTRGGGDVRRRR